MLLSVIRQSREPLTYTELGTLLGCSRQNIKKLADVLSKKGFISVQQNPRDSRAICIFPTERTEAYFQEEFARYGENLKYLFEVYTDDEVETLFALLSKLYKGMDNLEIKGGSDR